MIDRSKTLGSRLYILSNLDITDIDTIKVWKVKMVLSQTAFQSREETNFLSSPDGFCCFEMV
jgi:hypothetical protein